MNRLRHYFLKISLLVCVLAVGLIARGQVNAYSFAQSSGTYATISGTRLAASTLVGTAGLDDINYTAALPFDFTYNGVTYTTGTNINISTNGYITFGAAPGTTNYTPISSGAFAGAVSALGRDQVNNNFTFASTTTSGSNTITGIAAGTVSVLQVGEPVTGTGIPANSYITSIASGTSITLNNNATASGTPTLTAGGDIQVTTSGSDFIIQFQNWAVYSYYGVSSGLNYQIRLTQTSNTVSVVYGTNTTTTGSGTYPQVGLRGSTTGDFNNRTGTVSWASTTAGGGNTATVTLTPAIVPASGLTFTWSPPVPCSGTPTAGTASSTGVTCGAASGNVTLTCTGFTTGASGITFQWETSPDNATWTPIAGGTTSTYLTTVPLTPGTYVHCIVGCTPSGLSAPSTSAQVGTTCLQYTASRSTGISYTPVSGSATTLTPTAVNTDDANYGPFTFFPFTYAGATVSQFRVCSNGWMTLDAANTSTQYQTGLANSTAVDRVIAPFWEDLYVNNTATPNSQFVKYEITGSSPNRVLTVQWENVELFNYPGPSLNFQAKLYESDSHIEYVYGVMQGFDGTNPNFATVTNGLAFNYAIGLTGPTWGTPALAGQIIGLQQANSLSFSSVGGITQNEGINKNSVMPDCFSKYTFTPAGSVTPNTPAPGVPAAPSNDEPASPVILTTLPTTPANFCGSFYSSAYATASAGVAAEIAGTTADDDVWFKFQAISTNTTITVRGGGGYDAAMQIFNDGDLSTVIASKNANGIAGASLTETITNTDFSTVTGNWYLVRVYHTGGGITATATATVTSGAITGFTITTPGTGYITCNGGAGVTATPFVYITDPTGSGAVAKLTITGGAVTGIAIQSSQSGSGYTAPTVSIAPPGFGVTGDFSIIVNATPPPSCVTSPTFPVNGGTACASGSTTLSWPASAGATGYDVYLDNGAGTTLVSPNQPGLTYAAGVLPVGTYSWKVLPRSSAGVAAGCSVWTFTVQNPATAGTASGPASLNTGVTGSFSETGGSGGTLQWASSTTPGGPYTIIAGATSNPSSISFSSPGTYYLVLLRQVGGCTDAVSNELTVVVTTAGDMPCAAIPAIIGSNGPYSNVGATVDAGEVAPPASGCGTQTGWCNSTLNNTIWFTFTAPASGRVSIAAPGWDNQLALYSVTNCADYLTFSLLAANDDNVGLTAKINSTCLVPGVTYYIQLDGYSTTGSTTIDIVDLGNTASATISGSATICPPASTSTVSIALTGSQPWAFTYTDGVTPVTVTGVTTSPYTFAGTTGSTYTMVSMSDANCNGSVSGSATIGSYTSPTAAVSGDNSYCGSGTATVSVALTGTGPWNITTFDGTTSTPVTGIASSPYTFSVSPSSTTTYTVTAVSDANCTGSAGTGSATITVNPLPTIAISPSAANICIGSSSTLTASGGVSYVWSPGGSTSNPLVVSPTDATLYTVTGMDGAGCTNVASVTIGVGSMFTVGATATPSTICTGGSSSLAATATAIGSTPPPYCTTSYGSGTVFGDYLSNMTIKQGVTTMMSNSTGASASPYYTNYASPTASLAAGTSYTFTGVAGTYTQNDIGVWIDYNQDGDFADAGEKLGEVDNIGASPAIATINFTVPGGALNGPTRMRVREADQATAGGMSPCGALTYGEVEDYTITITGGASSLPLGTVTYAWTPSGDLSSPTGTPVTSTPAGTSTYTVTGTSDYGCTANQTVTVTVSGAPAFAVAAAPATICLGSSTDLTLLNCTTLSNFAGYFAPANWTTTQISSNGSVNTGGAPASISMTSSDGLSGSSVTRYSIPITCSGNITFNWSYTTVDDPGYDYPQYTINGGAATFFPGYNDLGSTVQSGTASIAVTAGDVFAFEAFSADNLFGACTFTISSFTAPASSGGTITWHDAPTGGTLLGSGSPLSVTPASAGTATYYGEYTSAAGCPNPTRQPASVLVNPNGQWLGITSDWTDANNWCGGTPTASSDVIIPATGTTPFDPHVLASTAGDVHNINIQTSSVTVDNGGILNLYGNVSLSPSGTFDATGGTVNFAGSSTQNILPGFTTANLQVNGGSNKNLTGDVTVTNNLNLTSGHVVLNNNDLIMASGATITGGSSSSYVQTSDVGSELVQEVNTGTGAVMFPVGNLNYNPATLTNTGTSDNFRVHVRDQVLDGGTSGSQVNSATTYVINHTWDIEEDVLGGSIACVTLQWGAGEENNPLFEYPHVYVSHYYAGSWHHDGYAYATDAPPATGANPYTSNLCGISSFSPFTIGSSGGSTPLPVHLTDVSATNEGPRNRVEWHSAAEAGLDHYEVERSTDGNNFSHMTDIAATGHAFGYLTYDNQPNEGLTYYRIKMVEQGGLSSLSQIVYAFMKVGDNETVTVFPNPVTDVLHVEVFGATEHASVMLTDLSGKVISPLTLSNGKAEISTANLASGIYFVKFTDGSVNQTIKVNKQ